MALNDPSVDVDAFVREVERKDNLITELSSANKLLAKEVREISDKDAIINELRSANAVLKNEIEKLKRSVYTQAKEDAMSEDEHSESASSSVTINASRPRRTRTYIKRKSNEVTISNRFQPLQEKESPEPKRKASTNRGIEILEDLILPASWKSPEPEVEKTKEPPKAKPPPPIVIKNRENYKNICEALKLNEVEAEKIITARGGGFKIFTKNSEDFRKTRRVLDAKSEQYHTFQLHEEKELKVVLRGVPESLEVEDIAQDLVEQGVSVNSIKRLGNKTRKFPLVMVNATKDIEGKKIFDIKSVCQARVTTEPKRKSTRAQQCYKCQQFGHVQFRCTANQVCWRCAGSHGSWECNQKEGPFKCCNCGGNHSAMFLDCPNNPTKKKQQKEVEQRQQTREKMAKIERSQRTNESYADRAKGTPKKVAGGDLEHKITRIVMDILPGLIAQVLKNV